MNHSADFWAVVAQIYPDYSRPRAWLRREGQALHRYRFTD
ncbi:MAG: putative metal-dependent hydrolase [Halocynthiibacter sp.]|jgi:predicted metal-dependent hydrolase